MPIGQIKAAAWLLAALLTLGLSAYVFSFVTALKERERDGIVDTARIKAALEDVPAITEQVDDIVAYDDVRRLFHDLNWTGYEPPPPPPPGEGAEAEAQRVAYTPVEELLRVLMVQYVPVEEAASVAWVRYKPAARVPPAPVVGGYALRVGDALAPPHAHVKVAAIGPDPETGRASVTFAFDDETREPERLGTEQFDPETMIVQVDSETGLRLAPQRKIPISTVQRPVREETREVSPNHFRLGRRDVQKIADNYPSFVNEIRPRRHRDPRTGRYDGIEIGDVPSGSMAARHGAETGDVIKSINGHPVTSPAEAINFAKNNADRYDKWEIVVERRGREETITYTPD